MNLEEEKKKTAYMNRTHHNASAAELYCGAAGFDL